MAIRAVTLKIRVKTTAGKWCVVKPVTDVKGRLKPLYAMANLSTTLALQSIASRT